MEDYQKLLDAYYNNYVLNIPLILSSLQKLNKNPSSIYYNGTIIDYTFSFKDGCTFNDLNDFERNIGYSLPEDYKQFLSYTNGLNLSNHAISRLLDLDSMYECRKIFGDFYHNSALVVGEFYDGDIHVIINLEAGSNKCIHVCEPCLGNKLRTLNCSFTEFLNRFIITYGATFWEWM